VCFGNIGLSTPLMHRLATDGVGLVMLDTNGRFKARLEGCISGNVLLRQAQHQRALDKTATLGIAKSL
jgi:CRISP-associated protein Cas1